MALLIPTVGEQLICKLILNGTAQTNVKCHLYSSNTTPGEGDTIATYTLITSPAAKTLTGSSWDYTTTPGQATYAQQDYTIPSTETVYGYCVTDSTGAILIWAERSGSAPYNFGSDGGTMSIDPKYIQS